MDPKDYLAIIGRRKWVIAITVAVAVAVAIIGTLLTTPVYEASTILRIAAASASGGSADYVGYDDMMYVDRLLNTYTKIATSDSKLQELAQKLGLPPGAKAPHVEAEMPANTELISIKAEDKDPALAARAANTLADILIGDFKNQYAQGGKTAEGILSQQLDETKASLDKAWKTYEDLAAKSKDSDQIATARRDVEFAQDQYARLLEQYERSRVADTLRADTISVVQEAAVPQAPSRPRGELNLGLGLLLGLVGGGLLVYLLEYLDTTLYTTKQIEATTELSTLARIPTDGRHGGLGAAGRQQRIHLFNSNSPHEEAFRQLRTNILSLGKDAPLRTLLITSAGPGEGKSTVVANLARIIAKSQRRVIVVDSDLRLPSLHKVFHLPNDVGLSSILKHEVTLEEALQLSSIPGVLVLTSGPVPASPAELLGTPQMAMVIKQLARQFDMVLLDTPALLSVTDASVLVPLVDGVVLVVGRTRVRQEALRATREQLAGVKAKLVGVVVNHAEQGKSQYRALHFSTD
jgi:polysaccharide biosynthesis transport protein